MTTEMEQEVSQLFAEGKKITLKKETIVVNPYGFGKFPKVMACLSALADLGTKGGLAEGKQDAAMLADLLLHGGEDVMTLCSLAIDRERKYFDTLSPDEGLELAMAILEVNRDFFIAKLQPKLTDIVTKLSKLAGAKSLLDSSRTATD